MGDEAWLVIEAMESNDINLKSQNEICATLMSYHQTSMLYFNANLSTEHTNMINLVSWRGDNVLPFAGLPDTGL